MNFTRSRSVKHERELESKLWHQTPPPPPHLLPPLSLSLSRFLPLNPNPQPITSSFSKQMRRLQDFAEKSRSSVVCFCKTPALLKEPGLTPRIECGKLRPPPSPSPQQLQQSPSERWKRRCSPSPALPQHCSCSCHVLRRPAGPAQPPACH